MQLHNICSDNIVLTSKNDIKYNSYEKGHVNIVLDLPKLKIPFGIENNYNKYEIKLELDDTCKFIKPLIRKIEKYIAETKGLENFKLVSNIRENGKYNDLLTIKIPYYRNKFMSKIESKNENIYLPTFYEIEKNMYASSTIHIKKFWILNNKYGLLIELKKLTIL